MWQGIIGVLACFSKAAYDRCHTTGNEMLSYRRITTVGNALYHKQSSAYDKCNTSWKKWNFVIQVSYTLLTQNGTELEQKSVQNRAKVDVLSEGGFYSGQRARRGNPDD